MSISLIVFFSIQTFIGKIAEIAKLLVFHLSLGNYLFRNIYLIRRNKNTFDDSFSLWTESLIHLSSETSWLFVSTETPSAGFVFVEFNESELQTRFSVIDDVLPHFCVMHVQTGLSHN